MPLTADTLAAWISISAGPIQWHGATASTNPFFVHRVAFLDVDKGKNPLFD
jgi:hypothetical protein